MRSLFLICLLIALLLMSFSSMYECEHFKRYLDHEAYGKVTKKYLDSTSHMWPTIVYQTLDGKVVDQEIAMYIPALYDILEIGDTIAKTSESTMVTVTKHGGLVIKLDTAKESISNAVTVDGTCATSRACQACSGAFSKPSLGLQLQIANRCVYL